MHLEFNSAPEFQVGDLLAGRRDSDFVFLVRPVSNPSEKTHYNDSTRPKSENTYGYENKRLGRKIQGYLTTFSKEELKHDTGYRETVNRIVELNLPLARSKQTTNFYMELGLESDDVIQESNFALIEAAETYNPEYAFSTYARIHIRKRLNKFVYKKLSKGYHFPYYLSEKRTKINSIGSRLKEELDRPPSFREIADEFNNEQARDYIEEKLKRAPTEQEVEDFYQKPQDPKKPRRLKVYQVEALNFVEREVVSINQERETTDGHLQVGYEPTSPLETMVNSEEMDQMREALKEDGRLDEMERYILIKRFGLDGEEPLNLREIGDELGYTRERMRQIQKEGLRKLRFKLTLD